MKNQELNSEVENVYVKNAIQIEPVVIDFFKKTLATQLKWTIISIERDENAEANSLVELFNNQGISIGETNLIIPSDILAKWDDNMVIDSYILETLELTTSNNK